MVTISFGWPQLVMIGMYVFDFAYACVNNGKPQGNYSVFTTILGTVVSFVILYAGGFWGCN